MTQKPIHPAHMAARVAMCERLIRAMDALKGRPITADQAEQLTEFDWAAILAGETRRPSDATIKLLADMLLTRDRERGSLPGIWR